MTVKKEVLARYKKNILIETGTYLGQTAKAAVNAGYQKVYTIELQDFFFNTAKANLQFLITRGRVEMVKGDSRVELGRLLETISEPCVILLDAHIDGSSYVPDITPDIDWCPLYHELSSIKNHPVKTHTILIDDLRMIGKVEWGTGVSLEKIIEMLREINPAYRITYEAGETPEDVLVAKLIENG
jgi:hypothetical protein